jgi:hypothetical protein
MATATGELWSSRKAQAPVRDDRCEHCTVRMNSARSSIWELAAAVLCVSLWLTVLMYSGWVAYQWMDREGHRSVNDPGWHEPLDDWSL